jgi:hypothetical protein
MACRPEENGSLLRAIYLAALIVEAGSLALLFITHTRDPSIVLAAFVLCSLAGAACAWTRGVARPDGFWSCGKASVFAILPWLAIMYYWSPPWGGIRKFFEVFVLVHIGVAYGIGRVCVPPLARMLWKRKCSG